VCPGAAEEEVSDARATFSALERLGAMARIARSRLARISTHLARSSGSHTNSDTPVGMPVSSA
jgi:hypothetical protein